MQSTDTTQIWFTTDVEVQYSVYTIQDDGSCEDYISGLRYVSEDVLFTQKASWPNNEPSICGYLFVFTNYSDTDYEYFEYYMMGASFVQTSAALLAATFALYN